MSSVGRRGIGRFAALFGAVLAMGGNLFSKMPERAEPLKLKREKPIKLQVNSGGFGDEHPIKRSRPRKRPNRNHISRAAKMKHKMRKKYNY